MSFQYSPFILPLIAAVIVSGGVGVYAWRHRHTTGAFVISLISFAITVWSVGYAFEIAGADLATKIFWGKVQYVGIVSAPVLWLIFALIHTNQGRWLSRPRLISLSVIPLITLGLVATTESHGLIWRIFRIQYGTGFSALGVDYGLWFWVHSVYSYLAMLGGTVLLLRFILQMQGVYRGQAVALVVAAIAPWTGNILYLANISPIPYLDLTPFSFTISTLALTWGIVGFQLIDLNPLARDLVVEEMREAMIVLDARGRIIDINPAAQRLTRTTAAQAIGQQVEVALAPWTRWVERYRNVNDISEEITTGEGAHRRWFEVRMAPLHDRRQRILGRVITLRDITESKRAQTLTQGFSNDIRALQELHLTLSEISDLETLYITMVDLAQKRLGLDRVGLFILDPVEQKLFGTYGVDPNGHVRDERYYREDITPDHWTFEILNTPSRAKLWNDAPLYDNGQIVGTGWKVGTTLWTGESAIGYLICDNFITRKPARPYEAELIAVLGVTFRHLIEQKRAA